MKTPFTPSRLTLAASALLGMTALLHCNRADSAAPQRVEIAVTSDGFVSTAGPIKVGQPVTLVVTRKVEATCATDLVIKDYGISKPLPNGTPVEVTFTPTKPGKVHYACAMDMISGDLVVQ